jgi:hypothetical protein
MAKTLDTAAGGAVTLGINDQVAAGGVVTGSMKALLQAGRLNYHD